MGYEVSRVQKLICSDKQNMEQHFTMLVMIILCKLGNKSAKESIATYDDVMFESCN